MAVGVKHGVADGLDEGAVIARLREDGLAPHSWGNGPDDTYGWHQHAYEKVLYCVSGSIVFHTHGGDVAWSAGDRMVLPPGTEHAATVGPDGCRCVEASR